MKPMKREMVFESPSEAARILGQLLSSVNEGALWGEPARSMQLACASWQKSWGPDFACRVRAVLTISKNFARMSAPLHGPYAVKNWSMIAAAKEVKDD
jgi:hypothetical protein